MAIPVNPTDLGYFDISKYVLDSFVFLKCDLSIKFKDSQGGKEGFIIELEEIVAYRRF